MNDLEMPVAKIDHIAVEEDAGRGSALHLILRGDIRFGRQHGEYVVGHIGIGQCRRPARMREEMGFGSVDAALGEFVMAADMIVMSMAGDGHAWLFGNQRHMLAKRHDAHAAIDQHIAIASAHMPDVAAIEFLDMRLTDIGDVIADAARLDTRPGSRRVIASSHQHRDVAGTNEGSNDLARRRQLPGSARNWTRKRPRAHAVARTNAP